MSDSSDSSQTPRNGEAAVEQPVATAQPQPTQPTHKPVLDADEMRRRRLAKIGGPTNQTVNAPQNSGISKTNTTTHPVAPVEKLGKIVLDPNYVGDTTPSSPSPQAPFNSTAAPAFKVKASPRSKYSDTTLFELAELVCGSKVVVEQTKMGQQHSFQQNPMRCVGDAVLELCLQFYSDSSVGNGGALKPSGAAAATAGCDVKAFNCLLFLFELNRSAAAKTSELKSDFQISQDSDLKQKIDLTSEIEKMASRYAVLNLTQYFNYEYQESVPNQSNSTLFHLLLERSDYCGFLVSLCSVISSEFVEETLAVVFTPLLNTLSYTVSVRNSVNDPIGQAAVDILVSLFEIQVTKPGASKPSKPIVDQMVKLASWLPPPLTLAEGRELQKLSFLGPFLSVSCLNDDDPLFATALVPKGLNDFKDIVLYKKIHQEIQNIRAKQFNIVYGLLINQATRSETLDLVSNFLTRNSKRAQMNPDATALATHGFMLNLLQILCKLEKKVPLDKVDPQYLLHPSCRFDLSSESLMKMTSVEMSEYKESLKQEDATPKFNTECFFFTLFGTHLCFVPVIKHFTHVIRTYKQLKSVLQEAEKQQREAGQSNSFVETRLTEMKQQLDGFYRSAVTLGAVLSEENLLSDLYQYYAKVMDLLLSMVSPNNSMTLFSKVETPELPLPSEVPKPFASFPSFVIEDISDFISCVVRHSPSTVAGDPVSSRSLVNFLVTFACSAHYISNPYLVAKIIEIIYYLNPAVQPSTVTLYQQIIDHKEAIIHFAPNLIQFYVAIESTGSSNEFYDKFSIRYHLTIIFMSMWSHPTHKASMVEALNSGGPFVRFVNLLINDTTFLLDESLECIKRIHETQKLMNDPQEWNKLSKEQQTAKKKKLQEDESQCRSYMTLVNETLNMFHYLTHDVQKPFLLPEIIGRLAAMLNCYLAQLVGPNYHELNIKNRDKYGFQPKLLLGNIVDLYLHLDSKELVEAIAADDRSYREEIFTNAEETLKRTGLKTVGEMEEFLKIAAEAKQCYLNNIQMEEDFEDAPDQYRDPITQALMTDPVRLPSGKVMDRSVLTRILLDSAIDPFSRQPLSQESVEECPELRVEIENWKRNRRSNAAQN